MDGNSGTLLLYLGGILVVGAIPSVFMIMRARQQSGTWQKMAGPLGLTFESSGGEARLSGTYRGRGISAEAVVRGAGKMLSMNTLVQVAIKQGHAPEITILRLPAPISLKDREKARQYDGYEDIVEMGDPELDRNYMVKTADVAHAQELLAAGSMFRHSIEALFKGVETLQATISPGMFAFEVYGRQTNAAKFQKMLDGVCDTAEALEAAL